MYFLVKTKSNREVPDSKWATWLKFENLKKLNKLDLNFHFLKPAYQIETVFSMYFQHFKFGNYNFKVTFFESR